MVLVPAPTIVTSPDELIVATLVVPLEYDFVPVLFVVNPIVYAASPYVLVVGEHVHVGVPLLTVCVPVHDLAL